MNKKQTERIITIGLAGILVAYFCYQMAYGIEMTIGPKGTMTLGDMPSGSTVSNIIGNATEGSATIHLGPPPNGTVNNFNITPEKIAGSI